MGVVFLSARSAERNLFGRASAYECQFMVQAGVKIAAGEGRPGQGFSETLFIVCVVFTRSR